MNFLLVREIVLVLKEWLFVFRPLPTTSLLEVEAGLPLT